MVLLDGVGGHLINSRSLTGVHWIPPRRMLGLAFSLELKQVTAVSFISFQRLLQVYSMSSASLPH